MFCRHCGEEVEAGARFCGACGKEITTAGVEPYRPASRRAVWWTTGAVLALLLAGAAGYRLRGPTAPLGGPGSGAPAAPTAAGVPGDERAASGYLGTWGGYVEGQPVIITFRRDGTAVLSNPDSERPTWEFRDGKAVVTDHRGEMAFIVAFRLSPDKRELVIEERGQRASLSRLTDDQIAEMRLEVQRMVEREASRTVNSAEAMQMRMQRQRAPGSTTSGRRVTSRPGGR